MQVVINWSMGWHWSNSRVLPSVWNSSCNTSFSCRQLLSRFSICFPPFFLLPSSLKQLVPLPIPPPLAVIRTKSCMVFWDSSRFSKVMQFFPELIANWKSYFHICWGDLHINITLDSMYSIIFFTIFRPPLARKSGSNLYEINYRKPGLLMAHLASLWLWWGWVESFKLLKVLALAQTQNTSPKENPWTKVFY